MIYKILFEVKLLHEFFLTDHTGKNIFTIPLQADRIDFLYQLFEARTADIDTETDFVVPAQGKAIFDQYKLKLLPAYAGYKVAIEVIAQKLGDGTVVYRPKYTLPADLSIPVLILKRSFLIDQITSGRMEKILKGAYYLSNDSTISGSRSFPFLSAEIPAFSGTANYEAGELVKFGASDYREFYKDDLDAAQWNTLPAGGFVNENDRLLLPLNFYYHFPKGSMVKKATFILKDKGGNVVDTFSYQSEVAYTRIMIAVDPQKVIALPQANTNNQFYNLVVSGDDGYAKTHKILFYQEAGEMANCLAMVDIKLKPATAAFNLLDGSGLLMMRKNADGSVAQGAPVFEIRLKSKSAFWRYSNNKSKALKSGTLSDFLISKNGALLTKSPRALTSNVTLFKKADNTLYYLPNPAPDQPLIFENNRLYSDILVPESVLFPLEP